MSCLADSAADEIYSFRIINNLLLLYGKIRRTAYRRLARECYSATTRLNRAVHKKTIVVHAHTLLQAAQYYRPE